MRPLALLLALILSSAFVFAQPNNDRVAAYKISFITTELNLTPAEAQTFWPIYNEMEAELSAIREQMEAARPKGPQALDNLSDEELARRMEQLFDLEAQELAVKRAYHEKYLTVLPTKKVAQLHMAERRFKVMLLNEIRKRREGGPGDGRMLRR